MSIWARPNQYHSALACDILLCVSSLCVCVYWCSVLLYKPFFHVILSKSLSYSTCLWHIVMGFFLVCMCNVLFSCRNASFMWCYLLLLLMLWCSLTLFTMQFVARLTAGIIQTYLQCDPEFKYSEVLNPKRFLTSPSTPAHNDGLDNANWDLILYVNLELVNKMSNRRLFFFHLVFAVPYLLVSWYWTVPCYYCT